MNKYMSLARNQAIKGIDNKEGGPFGAVIVKDDKVISVCNNTVIKDKDATAHAEINAIRQACKVLNTYDLSGCVLYTTSEPCPMCAAAIIWSNITKVYYGIDRKHAEEIGFRDKKIYDYFKDKNHLIDKNQIDKEECAVVFEEYEDVIY